MSVSRSIIKLEEGLEFEPMGFINKDELVMWSATSGFLYNVKNERGLEFTTQKTGAKVVTSRNVRHSITEGVVDGLSNFNGLRMYMIETADTLFREKIRKVEPIYMNVFLKYNVGENFRKSSIRGILIRFSGITMMITSTFNRKYSKARLVNGSAYIVEDSYKHNRGIISFDLSSEIFRETALPTDIWYNNDFIIEEYRGLLALIGRAVREHKYVVVIWILKVIDDNSYSWDEMSVIKEESNTFQPMGFINKEELVMWSATCGFLHNVKNECRHQLLTIPDTRVILVQSSGNFKSSIGVIVVATLGNNYERMYMIEPFHLPIRKPKMKEVALTPTNNRFKVS
ncbi:hypothetical protein POM88_004568 [Heracleum sosnowskyi]|uniref:F-box associated beta-propeller type 3 domain-containing protein n=1 Tax=Heracleum sosnowskyi TaxID=360622 RepID=A0AAD8JJL7_9APIA|nr:hypothetical protein POM88_004568 [Heracleum sosnowskyi]